MKKLILILVVLITACNTPPNIHLPMKVISVEINTPSYGHNEKYIVHGIENYGDFYTDSLYKIGDIIK